ncbi:DUF1501 domain-containing protein [Aquimarina pacifica]|uniref:DUF1501 domain-containing protein n=1 Tax=Aquimarina pacifica TaxID=1296415 RepID=UPI000471DD1D|nr:DUF1501 domain-containing protein [Aquimarina pacifica]
MKKHYKSINHNSCNHNDHDRWNRRSFLQALGLATGGAMTLGGSSIAYSKDSMLSSAINKAESDNILVIVKLFGGNDALNMIVPINQYDAYANARPTIKVPQNNLIKLSDEYGMNNVMSSLEGMWGEGQMKIINSVGYEDHSRSHFKGSDIWASAQLGTVQHSGWLGRYLEDKYPDYLLNPPESPTAIQIGNLKNITFNGEGSSQYSFSVANINRLKAIASEGNVYDLQGLPDCTRGDKLEFVRALVNSTFNYADVIYDAYNSSNDYGNYPNNNFSRQLSIISRLIKGNLGTKIYMITVGGFDTHSEQVDRQSILLKDMADSISYFYEDLTNSGWGDKVLSMGISEFGRRVKENGTGTDHGTAGAVMLFGGGLNGSGMVGEHSSLTDLLSNGDMYHNTDFRSVYGSILKEWMCVDASVVNSIVLYDEYESLELGFKCGNEETEETDEEEGDVVVVDYDDIGDLPDSLGNRVFNHATVYDDNKVYLDLDVVTTQHIVVSLYSISGQKLGDVKNQIFLPGSYRIDLEQSLNAQLSSGHYIYRLSSNKKSVSAKVMIQ